MNQTLCTTKTLKSDSGLTLTELLISVAIIALVAGVSVQLVAGSLDSWRYSKGKAELLNTAQLAMERMVTRVRNTSWVLLPLMNSDPTHPGYPNVNYYPRDILAVSGNIDNDNDGLIDEDPDRDITGDTVAGIKGFDDDDDGTIDEGAMGNDDEDWNLNEEDVDGSDDDWDKRYDEDPGNNFYISSNDDDNDGLSGEDPFDPLVYYLNGTTLMERQNVLTATTADNAIAEHVTQFVVQRRRVDKNTLIDITLKLDDGEQSVELQTTVHARSMFIGDD